MTEVSLRKDSPERFWRHKGRPRVIVGCLPDPRDPERLTRHRKWVWVRGIHATDEHPYTEQQCVRCRAYRSEVYE